MSWPASHRIKANGAARAKLSWAVRLGAVARLGTLVLLCSTAYAKGDWTVGAALQRRLATPVDVYWSGNPLRAALEALARAQHVAVLIDRRIDPQQKLDVQLSATPLAAALREVAHGRQLETSLLGGVVYFGPPDAARRLRTLAALREEEIRRLPPATAHKFLQPQPLAWDDYTEPRALVEHLVSHAGFRIAGLSRVPHDLWAAADLPPLSLVDRLTLVAGQEDLTFEFSAADATVRLVPIPDEVALTRSYPGGDHPQDLAATWATLVPNARIKVMGSKIFVRGLVEDHERIASPRHGEESAGPAPLRADGKPHVVRDDRSIPGFRAITTATVPAPAARVHIDHLVVQEKPLGPVLEQLATRLKFELHADRDAWQAAGVSWEQRVSVHVENGTLDDVLRGLLKTTPLVFHRQGNVVEVGPPGK